MTATEHRPTPPAAGVLQLVGIILVLTFFLDFIIRLIALPVTTDEMQYQLLNEFIDRGVMPLIGLALVYVGFWLKQTSATPKKSASAWKDPNFWTFVFASLLGLLFLVVVPFHYSMTGKLFTKGMEQFDQRVAQDELRVQQGVRGLEQEKQQWQAIAKDANQVDALLQNPQLPPEQKAQLQELKKNPAALEQAAQNTLVQIEENLKQVKDQQGELEKRKAEQVDQAKGERLLSRARSSMRSLLLALGFAIIGWTGLRDSR
ncbi:MAG: HpsJ family protein [Thermosynechococcaceae cyanobacterium]